MPSFNPYTIVYENPAFVPLLGEWNKNNHKQKRLFLALFRLYLGLLVCMKYHKRTRIFKT
ncbi:MAG: hypothetical protein JWQ85_3035 [Mucilaginibacter sp.]|nr:hypothetical protein [Mucilaginibacter sp.]